MTRHPWADIACIMAAILFLTLICGLIAPLIRYTVDVSREMAS